MQKEINWFETILYTYFGIAAPLMLVGIVFKIKLLFLIGGGMISIALIVGTAIALYTELFFLWRRIRRGRNWRFPDSVKSSEKRRN